MIEQKDTDDLVVIADNPTEMVDAQHATIGAVSAKLTRAEHDLADANETLKHLTDANMATTAAERIVKRAESRVQFLAKAKQALEAGYVIVPEMPCDVVAIRVKRRPKKQHTTSTWGTPSIDTEAAPGLAAGEGQYADPLPATQLATFDVKDKEGKDVTRTHRTTTGEWDTDIALPAEFLRPTVVQRTGRMMMRKIFDEVAVVGASTVYRHGRAMKADPMVIGSVIDTANKRKLWFLIAWFLDTSTI